MEFYTAWLLLICVMLLLSWDLLVALNDRPGDTISEVLLGLARKSLLLPTAIGIVVAHLLWPSQHQLPAWQTASGLLLIAIGLGAIDLFHFLKKKTIAGFNFCQRHPIVMFFVGLIFGKLLWPQK